MTTEQLHSGHENRASVERRLLDALQAAGARRQRQLLRQEQRKSHWLSSFARFDLDRHHRSETQSHDLELA
jgi:hypothetical protein